ncbi:S26 family signal peptidase [Leptolyngbya sp. 7M]|uniref:S26 family signal peptidase n=1 Tax=Leptolyngbya sp. 7M TaxID=2812896 RepID=UPI001B8D091A|nr:S26 family signal peptidase [Leptolyngbya sp. 7M]QYO64951.1 S26 family signal peptidase [Leptolyngbya sp. 7M]
MGITSACAQDVLYFRSIPPDSFVVSGDNRNNAFDSHFWGVVPRDHVLRKVVWCYWLPERFGEVPWGRLGWMGFDMMNSNPPSAAIEWFVKRSCKPRHWLRIWHPCQP